jgi:hypothetical protein
MDMGNSDVTYKDGRREKVPVCQGCGLYMFADSTYDYAFTIHGVAHDWASADDLKGVIEEILRDHMPKDDVRGMEVDVAVSCSYSDARSMVEE